MPELYHWEPNIFYLKPMVALAEKGVDYHSHYFDPTNFEQFGAAFPHDVESQLQLEREGPLLLHDGAIIASSFFMLEYIAETFPGPSLLPTDAYDRYRMHAWGQVIALSVASAVTTLGCARYLAPALRTRAAEPLRSQIAAIEPLERRQAAARRVRQQVVEPAFGLLAVPTPCLKLKPNPPPAVLLVVGSLVTVMSVPTP